MIPWGPLATGEAGGGCGETDVRIADPESVLKTPVTQRADDCPPPEFTCPNTLYVTIPFAGLSFRGTATRITSGSGFGTFHYIAFETGVPIEDAHFIAGTIQFTTFQCWRLANIPYMSVSTTDYTIDETDLIT